MQPLEKRNRNVAPQPPMACAPARLCKCMFLDTWQGRARLGEGRNSRPQKPCLVPKVEPLATYLVHACLHSCTLFNLPLTAVTNQTQLRGRKSSSRFEQGTAGSGCTYLYPLQKDDFTGPNHFNRPRLRPQGPNPDIGVGSTHGQHKATLSGLASPLGASLANR